MQLGLQSPQASPATEACGELEGPPPSAGRGGEHRTAPHQIPERRRGGNPGPRLPRWAQLVSPRVQTPTGSLPPGGSSVSSSHAELAGKARPQQHGWETTGSGLPAGSELGRRHPREAGAAAGQPSISPRGRPPEPRFRLRLLPCQKGIFLFPSAASFGTFRQRFQHGGPGWGAQGEEQQLPRLSRSPRAEERCPEHSTGLLRGEPRARGRQRQQERAEEFRFNASHCTLVSTFIPRT